MIIVRINSQDGGEWLYGHDEMWKENCGVENFDETFVIHGNRDYKGIEEAEWYDEVKYLMKDLDEVVWEDDGDVKSTREYHKKYTDEQWKAIVDIYDNCKYSDSDETYLAVLKVIYPNDKWETGTICGYTQSEWNNVLYKANEVENLTRLEEYYYGHVAEIYADSEDSCSAIITHDELWKAERENTLEKLVKELLDIPKDEKIKIYESDGYVRIPQWKELS